MSIIEASIENVNCIEVEVLDSQTEITVSVNLVPEIEVQAFDYPPEIEALTQRVASTEELSLSANEVAVESKEIAANAEALAESAANTIDNHLTSNSAHEKESIEGIKISDQPEFVDSQITPLKDTTSGGEIPDVEWTWLGVIAENKKKILKVLKAIISNIYGHQNTSDIHNGVIVDYTVPEDVVQIDFNVNIPPNKSFTIYISSPAGYDGTSIIFRVNDISTTNYQALAAVYSYFVVYTNNSYFNGMLDMILIRGNVIIGGSYARASTVPTYTAGVYAETTFGLTLTDITKLSFIRGVTAVIKAGTKIIIKYK